MRARRGFAGAVAMVMAVALTGQAPASAQGGFRESLPADLPDGPAKEGFDIDRFSNFGNGWFETFYVEEPEWLRTVLDEGRLEPATRVLVFDTADGKLALLQEQMSFHHLAQGTAGGKDWLATF